MSDRLDQIEDVMPPFDDHLNTSLNPIVIDFDDQLIPVEIRQYGQCLGLPFWGVACCDRILNQQGKWEWEPRPSERDDSFLNRCRFASHDEALEAYRNWKSQNQHTYPGSLPVSTGNNKESF